MQKDYIGCNHVTDPVVHVRVRWIMETPKEHSVHQKCQSFQNVEVGHCTEEEEELPFHLSSAFKPVHICLSVRMSVCLLVLSSARACSVLNCRCPRTRC